MIKRRIISKIMKTYCPTCKKHAEHQVELIKLAEEIPRITRLLDASYKPIQTRGFAGISPQRGKIEPLV